MSTEQIQAGRTSLGRRFRADGGKVVVKLPEARAWCVPTLIAVGLIYVLVGGGNADLTGSDARLGVAAGEGFGPVGQLYGQWRPDLWPLPAAISRVIHLLGEPGRPDPGVVLWPSAVAGLAAGWILARRFVALGKTTTAFLFGFAWFGSLALMSHAGSSGIDFLSGMATVAALDRMLSRRTDWITGIWASMAFLAGGWPPLVILGLAVIVLGRRDADFSIGMIAPPVLTMVAWLVWTVQVASAQAAAAALMWPLTQRLSWTLPTSLGSFLAALASPMNQRPAWALPIGCVLMGMPLSPFAFLAASGSLRERFKAENHGLVLDWLRVGIAAMVGGMIVPGLASASALPALGALIVVASAGLSAAWSGELSPPARRGFFAIVAALVGGWVFVTLYGTYLLTIVFTYYRPIGVVFAIGGVVVAAFAWRAFELRCSKRGILALLVLTACLKWVHAGYYSPEWTYRYGQGPWGRAIGQWLLPHWPIYTLHEWPEDLAFAIGRPIQMLHSPQHLAYPQTSESKHVLLLESEYENWPPSAPKLVKVATFEPSTLMGNRRILARTEGVLLTPSGKMVSRVPAPR